MQNQILGFFIVTTIAFAGLSAMQWKRSASYRDQVVAVRQEAFEEAHRAEMREAEMRSLERRLQQRDEDAMALTEMVQSLMETTNELSSALAMAQASAHQSEVGETTDRASTDSTSPLGMIGKMMEDPAMRQMLRAQQKMMIDTLYGPLFRDLRLTDEETAALKEALLDAHMDGMKLSSSLLSGSEEERQAAAELMAGEENTRQERIREILGEDRWNSFEEYQKTMGDRAMLAQFKNQLENSNFSLGEDQYAQLMQVTLEERQQMELAARRDPNDPLQALELMQSPERMEAQLSEMDATHQRILQRAMHFLTAEQVSSLEEFYQNQLQVIKLGWSMGRFMANDVSPSAASDSP